jgi:DNA-binding winged helix-turn-helix (wHTH) protein
MQGKPIYEFGRFRLEPAGRRLLYQGQPVSLSPQLFSLLVVFVENSGKLISKEALRNKVWGNAYVSEDALKVIIGNLRKAIGENGEGYIETVRGGGYRFVLPVTTVDEVKQDLTQAGRQPTSPDFSSISATRASADAVPSTPAPKIRSLWVSVGACMIAALAVASGLYWSRVREKDRLQVPTNDQVVEQQARPSIAIVGFRNLSGMQAKAWLSTAFSEMLSTELAAGKGLRVVPPGRVARAKRELTIMTMRI